MKKLAIINTITRGFHKIGFQLKKYSPEILTAVGIAGGVASAVMACKATIKATEILEESKNTIDSIHECLEKENLKQKYTIEDSKKDLANVYINTTRKLLFVYGPSVLIGATAIASTLASHNILSKRKAAITAAYSAIDKSYKFYRERVADRFGEDVERELRYDIKAKEFEETITDENGNETVEKKTVNVAGPLDYSDYACVFDEICREWEKDSEYNLMFLRARQQEANDRLKAQGYLFLNDVYDMLDIPRTKAGQQVGWIYDTENPIGDNYVDFGIYDTYREKVRDFINGYERSIILDFNVDGPILDYMP